MVRAFGNKRAASCAIPETRIASFANRRGAFRAIGPTLQRERAASPQPSPPEEERENRGKSIRRNLHTGSKGWLKIAQRFSLGKGGRSGPVPKGRLRGRTISVVPSGLVRLTRASPTLMDFKSKIGWCLNPFRVRGHLGSRTQGSSRARNPGLEDAIPSGLTRGRPPEDGFKIHKRWAIFRHPAGMLRHPNFSFFERVRLCRDKQP
jgi:hypothetical protein